jgi:hypothetical protein
MQTDLTGDTYYLTPSMARKMARRDRDDYGDLVGAISLDRHTSFTFSPLPLHKPAILNAILHDRFKPERHRHRRL